MPKHTHTHAHTHIFIHSCSYNLIWHRPQFMDSFKVLRTEALLKNVRSTKIFKDSNSTLIDFYKHFWRLKETLCEVFFCPSGWFKSHSLPSPDTAFPYWVSVRVTCFRHLWKESSEASASHLGLLNLTYHWVEFSSITMSNKFLGTWKLVSSENFDEYMKALGKKCSLLF